MGTGFFLKLETNDDNKPLYCLMSNEHVILKDEVNSKTEIEIWYDNQHQKLKITLYL